MPDERLAVGGGADVDVAALAVGEHEQPGVARRSTGLRQRVPARRAEALEAGQLRLDRDAGRAGRVDDGSAVGRDGAGGALRRGSRAGRPRVPGQRRAGSGSSPRTTWDWRLSTRLASRSAKRVPAGGSSKAGAAVSC